MKGRESKGAPSADLLVCFPSRARLTLLPKPICSPARPSEPNKRRHHHHHHLRKASNRGGGGGGGQGGSPLLWTEIAEPTSPKVTCAGQIKVRPKAASSCKNWQSVMEDIERLHNNNNNSKHKKKKRPNWVEALGFKKDVMQFLTCLRSIRFDFRCFGSFPASDITSDDDDDDMEGSVDHGNDTTSRTVFSKWFMVLQENQNKGLTKEESTKARDHRSYGHDECGVDAVPCAPPSNALLLMRCRSAPAKSWLEERELEADEDEDEDEDEEREKEEENKAKLVMRYDTEFYKFSSDIAKETWVVGGIRDPLSRSRSWKR
uniref:Uncharacterized protein n=1 Tax=Davidia involucrata TaxID=16924 RepID=A0A5B7AW63_DAVIN